MNLYLKDGSVLDGTNFGADVPGTGEVVFNTSMVGYVESLTDPSYAGQILVCTYPLIGNYGVPPKERWESSRIHVAGLIVSEYSEEHSHRESERSLGAWLQEAGVPAISVVDTRALTKKLREHGVMLGAIGTRRPKAFPDPNVENLVAKVSPREVTMSGSGSKTLIAVDCGMKENIMRSLARPGLTIKRVPWNYDFTREKYDALFLSNGPGDPVRCTETIGHIRAAMDAEKPILGICLGNQLLALAAGGSTFKLPYGHRSQNQPCLETGTERCFITSQNHGYAVDPASLPRDWEVWFSNANDGSVEGIRHKKKPWMSVQFHPEACPGPTDTAWIFEQFLAKHLRV